VKVLGSSSDLWPVISSILPREEAELDFDEIISILERYPLEDFQRRIIRGLIHDDSLTLKFLNKELTLKQTVNEVSPAKREWLGFIGLFPYDEHAPIVQAFLVLANNPRQFRKTVISVVRSFWEHSFRETWTAMRTQYERSAEKKERIFHVASLEEFGRQALLRVQINEEKGSFRAVRGGYALSFDRIARCTFMPSAFNDRRYWSALEEGSDDNAVYVYFPYFDPELSIESSIPKNCANLSEPELDIALIFKALGDTSRFAIATLIAEKPATSVEISRALDISKPTVSHHIATLREAGLIEDVHLDGRNRIQIRRSTIDQLSGLAAFRLFKNRASGKVTDLQTTRRRKTK
jgi:DNA-binding transcriptional ArsR family regulator